jgi:hypothetical protein
MASRCSDIGHDFKQINPNWFDTMRVTKLPSFENQFGRDHNTFAGVRQTRFGVPLIVADVSRRTQDHVRIRTLRHRRGRRPDHVPPPHAYGELGQFGAGQTWSPFMDPDVFPNSLEYWGPTGMVFFRNVQVRWMPLKGNSNLVIAAERPGASGDQGVYSDRVELSNIKARFPMPDITGAYKYGQKWGYVRVAGAVRVIKWDDMVNDALELSGDATGWGINLSSNLNLGKDVVRLQYVFGEGIQNYMNDSPVDIGIENNFSNPVTPIVGKPLPIQGPRGVHRSRLVEQVLQHVRIFTAGHRQHQRAGAERLQGRSVPARQHPVLSRAKRDGRCGAAVGPA